MPRIIAIDYGLKRTGIAVTDPFQIIATGLTTVESKHLITFLKDYFSKEEVEMIIIGEPKNWDDTDTHATPLVEKCIVDLKKNFPSLPIQQVDHFGQSFIIERIFLCTRIQEQHGSNNK